MEIYVPTQELETYALSVARETHVTGMVSGRRAAAQVRRWLDALSVQAKRRGAAPEDALTQADRWLLENLYLARQAAGEIMPAFRQAGKLRGTGQEALITSVCRALLLSGDGDTDETRIARFLNGFQQHLILLGKELSLVSAALRAVVLEELSRSYGGQAKDDLRCGVLFTSLRRLSLLDLEDTLEAANRVDRLYRADPAGVYPLMDIASRENYRRRTAELARKNRISEYAAAEKVMELAARGASSRTHHVGFYLFDRPLGIPRRKDSGLGYILFITLLTAGICAAAGFAAGSLWAGLLPVLPVSELVKKAADRRILRVTPPRRLPRLELEEGVPPEGKTLCVISVLLTGEKPLAAAARRLEEFRMASRDCGENLYFGLLCDLAESDEILTASDRGLLELAEEKIRSLNEKYAGGFCLFTRERAWNRADKRFIPWERKRGAVLELCSLLAGDRTEMKLSAGEPSRLAGTRYILTLDSDTRLEPGCARELIGAALHPLNRPITDLRRGLVVRGHAVLHPRIAVSLQDACATDFSRLFSPQGGADPYGSGAGEVYMDRFESGGFAGKGLIHIQAYLDCMGQRIPDNAVLSHDALEGGYLRGGYVDDVELTDGFPVRPLSYYARLERWVRGDWQNLPWLFGPGRELPLIERWRLFDSLRRSLLAPGALAALLAWMFAPSPAAAVGALSALLCLFSRWLHGLFGELSRPLGEGRVKRRSGHLHGMAALAADLAGIILLPFEAWVCLSGTVCALWRMGISGKHLLQWQTAEQSEAAARGRPWTYFRRMWFSVVCGALLLALSPAVIGLTMGTVWMAAPLVAWTMGRKKEARSRLPQADRDWLLRRAGEIWRYFRDWCTPEDHFLPPDNVQDAPAAEPARRLSPTNLGFALLSAVCAAALGLAKEGEALGLCENLLSTAERLEKWHGNLYNWYDNRTLRPLSPAYVSTVDSGNLWACLLTVSQALRERGAAALAERADALRAGMELGVLYDKRRQLFLIGITVGDDTPPESWYDLLESEERLTGYIAVASGQVSRRHWRRLGRAQVTYGGYRGMASWSGTMFEYLMPELFLPLYRNSHLWESAKFAVHVQRQRTAGPDKLWGISESGFYAFDASNHYRYKAHGVPALALSRGMERDLVISPYSSYLALSVSPRAAMANLRKMDKAAYLGPYGLWEAVDFTPGRAGTGMAVRCVMAHHLGMSLAAITNALTDGAIRKWFLADAAMAAYTGLLQERVPAGGAILRLTGERKKAPGRSGEPPLPVRRGEGTDFLHPEAAALGNGAYSLLFTESGVSRAKCGALAPYRSPADPLETSHGLEVFLRSGQRLISLLPVPGDGYSFAWEFTAEAASLSGSGEGFSWRVAAGVSASQAGEWRSISLHRENAAGECELFLAFEPALIPLRDYAAHPSFARLGLLTGTQDGALWACRLPRGNQPRQYLALASDRTTDYSSDHGVFPTRSGGAPFSPNTGWQSQSMIAARVILPPGERETTLRFSLCVSGDKGEALKGAKAILKESRGAVMPGGEEYGEACRLLRALVWPTLAPSGGALPGVTRDALWKLGISGDVPIVAVECGAESSVPAGEALLRRYALLRGAGVVFDLVFLTGEDGEYRQACRAALEKTADKLGIACLPGTAGGIHFASLAADGQVLRSCAAVWIGRQGPVLPTRKVGAAPVLPAPLPSPGGKILWEYDEDDSFTFLAGPALPERAWCNILSGGDLGWNAADCGTGSLWYKNARECPLIPWRGDPLAAEGPERLLAVVNGRPVSFFAGRDGAACRVTYSFGTARWEKTVDGVTLRLTAFIPEELPVRVFLLESTAPAEVCWFVPLQMAPEPEDASACTVSCSEDALRAINLRCPFPDVTLTARCSQPWTETGTDAAFLLGMQSGSPRSGSPAICGRFRLSGEAVLLLGTRDAPELLSVGAARQALDRCRSRWRERVCPRKVSGVPESVGRLMNGWSAYQALCCRILGRSSVYQSGGAIGFRDQLQDYVNLLPLDPAACREHILACCAHQFVQGDVQHWWHPGTGAADKGVRTRCSDDLLWLPWAVCEYADATGDVSICGETAAFLTSEPLGENETSRYETPALSGEEGSVLEHCHRSLWAALSRGVGAHRLMLMGGGDWNDGFDAMGPGAESVWLTWFAAGVCHRFALLLDSMGKAGGDRYNRVSRELADAANDAWDGDHFLRGYYGDGTPLGASRENACRIDSVAQSFAAFCPHADPRKVSAALDTALRVLWDHRHKRILLYAPPFSPEDRSPGYVSSYGPGFRENGGQYTHAAVWLAKACFRTGRWEQGAALLEDIASAPWGEAYRAEPFVLSADISSAPGQEGRAGWSWYTGAAGWWFRTAWEDMLRCRTRDGKTVFSPPPEVVSRGWTVRGLPTGENDTENTAATENNS